MNVLVDDVGSFPLPRTVSQQTFNRAYDLARQAVVGGESTLRNSFVRENFHRVVVDSLRKKLACGLDVVNYPQHYDMYSQFLDVINKEMGRGTYIVERDYAVIPEIAAIIEDSKMLAEEAGHEIDLRVCITGPMELYLRMIGSVAYEDVLLMFSETVRRFAEKAIVNTKYVRTKVISIDEPSFGFQDISTDSDMIIETLEKAFDVASVTRQIHLHSPARLANLLQMDNIDVLSFELAASPENIESLSSKALEKADKRLRVGVARTDLDSIVAELRDRGVTVLQKEQLVDTEELIMKRFQLALEKYGNQLAFVGPDCGLGGWPSQTAAQLVLKRTVNAVKSCLT